MQIVVYISGHGFGHASRDIELIDAIADQRPETRFVVRTTVPAWLFERARAAIAIQPLECDPGMVQIDSLRFDEAESVRQAALFYRGFDQRADEEAQVLRRIGADLVVGDIPPLAFAAAARAAVPSVAVGNFTWDWIYSGCPAFAALAPDVIPVIRSGYRAAGGALRLPFHGGFETMAAVRDIPLIARRSRRDPADTRRLLGIPADRPLVLASFGAYGAALPYGDIGATSEFALLNVERQPDRGLRYEDLVAAADVVVSKPGYGIVSECIANHTALLYTSRGRFIEYDVFVDQMPRVLRCRWISNEELLAGRWAAAIAALLAQPEPPERWPVDGARVAAAEAVRLAR